MRQRATSHWRLSGTLSLEDPRPHLLLGELAVMLRDRTLLHEARTFLRFLKHESWEQKLALMVRISASTVRRRRVTASRAAQQPLAADGARREHDGRGLKRRA